MRIFCRNRFWAKKNALPGILSDLDVFVAELEDREEFLVFDLVDQAPGHKLGLIPQNHPVSDMEFQSLHVFFVFFPGEQLPQDLFQLPIFRLVFRFKERLGPLFPRLYVFDLGDDDRRLILS